MLRRRLNQWPQIAEPLRFDERFSRPPTLDGLQRLTLLAGWQLPVF